MKDKQIDNATGWTTGEIMTGVGWKQGRGYWLYKAPYTNTSADRKFVLKPPPGVKIEPDMKSALRRIKWLLSLAALDDLEDDIEPTDDDTDFADDGEDEPGEDFAGEPGEDGLIDGLIAQRERQEGKRRGGPGNNGNYRL